MKLSRQTILFYIILVAVTVIVKFICAPQINLSGFTGIIAVALFAGITTKNISKAFLLPLVTVFLSDVIIQLLHVANMFPFAGFYKGQTTNYILILLVTLIGIACKNLKVPGIFAAALAGPTLFFLVSNFFVWKGSNGTPYGYPNTFGGLMECYTFGLPFYRNSVLSTIIFLPLFMVMYNRLMYKKTSLAGINA